ncbi:hypothetical protein BGZ73_004611 [Actinomortierella ambigua]|nr:hypothetical protein BGZ73_004611 [Actinomortierella ambigua]
MSSHSLIPSKVLLQAFLVLCYCVALRVVAQTTTVAPTNVGASAVARTRTALYFCSGYVNFTSFRTTNQFYKLDLSVAWKRTSPAWQRLANGPAGAHIPGAFSRDEKTMVVFESFTSNTSPYRGPLAWFYSVDQDRWTTDEKIAPPVPYRQGIIAITVPSTNVVYFPRGYQEPDVSNMDVYDFERKTYGIVPIVDPTNSFYGRSYHTGVWSSYMQSILFFGGYGQYGPADNVTVFSPAQNTYTTLQTTGIRPTPRADHCAAISDDGTLMIIYGGRPITGTIHILDLKTRHWTRGLDGEVRIYHGCAIAGNQLVTWGGGDGRDTVGWDAPSLPARIYNIDTDQWVEDYTPPASYLSKDPKNPNNNSTTGPGTSPNGEVEKSSNLGLILGVSLGAAALLAAAIIGVIVVRRRRRRGGNDSISLKPTNASSGANGHDREAKALTTAVDTDDDSATHYTPPKRPSEPQQAYQQHTLQGDVHLHHHIHHAMPGPFPPTSGASPQEYEQGTMKLHGSVSTATTSPTLVNSPHTPPTPPQIFQPVYAAPPAGYSPTMDAASSYASSPSWSPHTIAASTPTQQLAMPPLAQPYSQQPQVSTALTAGYVFEPHAKDDQVSTANVSDSRPVYTYYETPKRQNNPHAVLN